MLQRIETGEIEFGRNMNCLGLEVLNRQCMTWWVELLKDLGIISHTQKWSDQRFFFMRFRAFSIKVKLVIFKRSFLKPCVFKWYVFISVARLGFF